MEPLLDITTLIERPTIRIDGVTYQMQTRKEPSVFEAEKLRLLIQKIQASEAVKKPTKNQEQAYVTLLRKFVGAVVLSLPARVLARLERPDLVAIIKAYFLPPQAPAPARTGKKTKGATAATSTGAK